LGVELVRDRERVGICFDDAVQSRTTPIDVLDARQIFFDQRACRLAPGLHPLLQVRNRRFFEIERALREERDAGDEAEEKESRSTHRLSIISRHRACLTSAMPAEPVVAGVHRLRTLIVNVYFVESSSGDGWMLVDTGLPGCAAAIRRAAERLF